MFFFNSTKKSVDHLIKKLQSSTDCLTALNQSDKNFLQKLIDTNDIGNLEKVLNVAPQLVTANKEFIIMGADLALIGSGFDTRTSLLQYAALTDKEEVVDKLLEFYPREQLGFLSDKNSTFYQKFYEANLLAKPDQIADKINKFIEKVSSNTEDSNDNRNSIND